MARSRYMKAKRAQRPVRQPDRQAETSAPPEIEEVIFGTEL